MPTTYAIKNGATAMKAVLQLGSAVSTGAALASQGGFTYGLAWGKDRTSVNNHQLVDTVRGTSDVIQSNTASASTTYSAPATTDNCVAWCWNSGAAAVSNTAGSITSSVSVNAAAGFSIVSYVGTNANATVGHGLSSAPQFILVKCTTQALGWPVYNAFLGSSAYLVLNSSAGAVTGYSPMWNATAPTSTVFSIGTDPGANQSGGQTYVAYCWAPVPGFSQFGGYTGNGSTSGPFIYTGFRPAFVMLKSATLASTDWAIWDTSRNVYNTMSTILNADIANAETTYAPASVNSLSNGFQIPSTWNNINQSGQTYIYIAFAECPFKYANAR